MYDPKLFCNWHIATINKILYGMFRVGSGCSLENVEFVGGDLSPLEDRH
jgi:hypothetical protein